MKELEKGTPQLVMGLNLENRKFRGLYASSTHIRNVTTTKEKDIIVFACQKKEVNCQTLNISHKVLKYT
jgi:hypothetical protein